MADILVRQAALDDTAAITRMFQAQIPVWQRVTPDGQVENVPSSALSLYERWLHGGPWMSVETGAIQLSRLLLGAGIALVAAVDATPLAYAEAYHGREPAPFGDNIHLARLVVHPDHTDDGLEAALVAQLLQLVRERGSQRLTVDRIANTALAPVFEQVFALRPLATIRRLSLPARTGQVFYQSSEQVSDDAMQIDGWQMPLGRTGSARQQWETLWVHTWDAIPQIRQRRTNRLHITAAGQEAFVCCQQQLYDSRSADIYCWSPKPLSNQILSAVRDWTHRAGYRTLGLAVTEETVKLFGAEAEPDIFSQDVCEVLPL